MESGLVAQYLVDKDRLVVLVVRPVDPNFPGVLRVGIGTGHRKIPAPAEFAFFMLAVGRALAAIKNHQPLE